MRGVKVDIDREMLKGSITLLLLNLLSRREMYGYEIIQEASRRSSDVFEFKEGTLYPALHLMEKRGLVQSSWRVGENGRERKYYALTAKGRKRASNAHEEWRMLTLAVNAILGSR
jgi:PadR family transcriptional regulator PadR